MRVRRGVGHQLLARAGTVAALGAGGLVLGVLGAPAAVAAGPGGAGGQVGGAGGSSGGGTLVAVAVTLTGNGAPAAGGAGGGSGGTVSVSVPSPCYWSSLGGAYDADSFADNYGDTESGNRAHGVGSEAQYLPSIELIESRRGQDGTWYTVASTGGADALEDNPGGGISWNDQTQSCIDGLRNGAPEAAGWIFVPAGQAPPAPPPPDVPVDLLLQAARENLTIPTPAIGSNPTASGYVNFPSWLWVQDGPGPADGFVDVEITATAGANSATVRAEANRFTATSRTGSASCTAEQARTPWSPGAADAAACTLTPRRASVGLGPTGYPVYVTTGYATSWQGVVGGAVVDGGPLPPVVVDGEFGLPVAEVQALVTG